VKEIQKPMYEAVDGQTFDTMKACAEHEIALLDKLLHSVAPDDIRAALKRRGFSIRADRSAPPQPPPKLAEQPERVTLIEANKPPREILTRVKEGA
jgi:hypothetical protein